MEKFTTKHQEKIVGTITCFDRVLFKGHLPISYAQSMEGFMAQNGLQIKDFKSFVEKHSERIRDHAKAIAETAGRPYVYLPSRVRKEDLVADILAKNGVLEGLVCVLAAVEHASTFKVAYGVGRPKIEAAKRKCLCVYFYFMDRDLGLMHIRLQTWFPFPIQVCLNGHEYLARAMDRNHIPYRKLDNAFLEIGNVRRTQILADRFAKNNWPGILTAFARRVNPLFRDLLKGMEYYWVTEQAEISTDIMFSDAESLKPLYEKMLKHAMLCFGAEDVMSFLGRKLHGRFEGEVGNHLKKRQPGARIMHRMKKNGIKMYDKHGCVLRIETVINHPYEFRVRRKGKKRGNRIMAWLPMPKGVAYLPRYLEVARTANYRYLDALAQIEDPENAQSEINEIAKPRKENKRSYRGFNPASDEDIKIFEATLRGENAIMGFRNKDIRERLFPAPKSVKESRRLSARTTIVLKRLHLHGYIAKVPRSRRWKTTLLGLKIAQMVVLLHHENYSDVFTSMSS